MYLFDSSDISKKTHFKPFFECFSSASSPVFRIVFARGSNVIMDLLFCFVRHQAY